MFRILGLAAAFAVVSAAPAFAEFDECSPPIPPAAVDGNTASLDQIKAAKQDVMTFLKQSDDYQDCVNHVYQQDVVAAKKDKKDVDPALGAEADKLRNDNQSLKEKVGGEFNAAVKAYNVKHPG